MKKKDIIVYSIGSFVGLIILISVIRIMMPGDEAAQPSSPMTTVNSNFSALNTEVAKEEVIEADNKTRLYDEELRLQQLLKETRASERRAKEFGDDGSNLNDIDSYLAKGEPVDKNKLIDNTKKTEVYNQSTVQSNVTTTHEEPKKNLTKKKKIIKPVDTLRHIESPEHKKRKRNGSIEFGTQTKISNDTENNNTRGSEFYNGIIHGEQEVTSGSRATIRLTDELVLPGCASFEANSIFTGKVTVSENRVLIRFSVPCEIGGRQEFEVVDATDNEVGLYFEAKDDDDQLKSGVAQDVATGVLNRVGVPVVNRSANRLVQNKTNSQKINLISGRKLMVQLVSKKK